MRITILLLSIFVLFLCSSAYGEQALNYSLNYIHSESFMDGEKTSTFSSLNQTYTFGFYRLLTPALNFNFALFVGLTDNKSRTEAGNLDTYSRAVSPQFNFRLQNPMYELAWGFSLQESWDTKDLSNEGRLSGDTLYARLNTQAWKRIPSFLFQFSRTDQYDHLEPKQVDSTATSYSASTGYFLGWKELQTSISGIYSHSETQANVGYEAKTVDDSYGINYLARYGHSWDNKLFIAASYVGGYQWQKETTYLMELGQVMHKRLAGEGLHAVGTILNPGDGVLSSEPALIDNDKTTNIGSIDIGTQQFHNIGLRLNSLNQTVDRLYIYVSTDVTLDTNLSNPSNWVAYSNNNNLPGTVWSGVAIQRVNIVEADPVNHVYRYEIIFSAPRTDLYYKVINLQNVNVPGITNVFVTEIEAIMAESVQGSGKYTSDASSISQAFNLGTTLVFRKVRLSFGYDVQRGESDPDSIPGAFGRFANSFFGKDLNPDLNGSVMRNYGPSISWTICPQLAASASYNRNEMFDDRRLTDISSNYYAAGLSSNPLPTLNVNLSVTRAESFNFGEKISTSDSVIVSTGIQLYPNIHLSTDGRVLLTKDEKTGLTTDTKYVNGNLDVKVTRDIFANFNYGLLWRDTGVLKDTLETGGVVVSYSGLRYFAISGSTQLTESANNSSMANNLACSWIIVPLVRLTFGYSYLANDPGTTTQSLSAYSMMALSRHLNLRITSSYSWESTGAGSDFIGVNLSGIF